MRALKTGKSAILMIAAYMMGFLGETTSATNTSVDPTLTALKNITLLLNTFVPLLVFIYLARELTSILRGKR